MEQDQTEQSDRSSQSIHDNALLTSIPGRALAVITNPAQFFATDMPRSGGYVEPLVFMVVVGVLTALVTAIVGLLGLAPAAKVAAGLTGVIIFPILIIIFGFVGAAIAFAIWKIMGSNENFETAYRCVAFSYAYAPIAAVVSSIPYLGTIISTLWPMALLALASIHVHGRNVNISWGVFGILGILLALTGLNAEHAARQMRDNIQHMSMQMQENLTTRMK